MRGGSQPILVQASDGLLYVVKFAAQQGANLPFNESMGTEVYRAAKLASPCWKPVQVTADFLDKNPDCWWQTAQGPQRPEPGICFGTRYLGSGDTRLLEILPGNRFKRVRTPENFWRAWMIDICAFHADHRQAVFIENAKGLLDAHFIDHGHLFGGPTGDRQPRFLASRYLDSRIYQGACLNPVALLKSAAGLDVDRLWQKMHALPEEWKTASAVENFAQFLERINSHRFLQDVLEIMQESATQQSYWPDPAMRGVPPMCAASSLCAAVEIALPAGA